MHRTAAGGIGVVNKVCQCHERILVKYRPLIARPALTQFPLTWPESLFEKELHETVHIRALNIAEHFPDPGEKGGRIVVVIVVSGIIKLV